MKRYELLDYLKTRTVLDSNIWDGIRQKWSTSGWAERYVENTNHWGSLVSSSNTIKENVEGTDLNGATIVGELSELLESTKGTEWTVRQKSEDCWRNLGSEGFYREAWKGKSSRMLDVAKKAYRTTSHTRSFAHGALHTNLGSKKILLCCTLMH